MWTTLKRFLQGVADRLSVPSPNPSSFAELLNKEPAPVLLAGVSGSGKSTLLHQARDQLHGCVIHLEAQLGTHGAEGWEDAPFWGVLKRPGLPDEDWDMPDVLHQRPCGVFELTLPCGLSDPRLMEALQGMLRQALDSPNRETRLTILVDEADELTRRAGVLLPVMQGRGANISWVLSNQRLHDIPNTMKAQFTKLCLLRTSVDDARLVQQWAGRSDLRTELLPRGEAAWVEPTAGSVVLLSAGV